jgi:predicted metal-binding membrane protein
MLAGGLLILAAASWLLTVRAMGGMSMDGRYALGATLPFLGGWVLMMAAMMFPSVWPAVMAHRRMLHRPTAQRRGTALSSPAFVVGYLITWTLFGGVAFVVVALGRDALSGLSDPHLARYVVAPIAVAGALYQIAPLKRRCLRHCRAPLFWLAAHWRDGLRGSIEMGTRHGAYCVGCCWLLMALMIAAGATSIVWMGLMAIAIAIEKLAPVPVPVASGIIAAGFLAVAVVALADPSLLPGFTGGGESM